MITSFDFEFLWNLKFWFLLGFAFILKSIFQMWKLSKRLPPGPTPLPFIGNYLNLRGIEKGFPEIILDLSRKYGDTMTLFFCNSPSIILMKYELAKDIFLQAIFSGRMESAMTNLLVGESQNISFATYNRLLQFHRKIASRGVRSVIDADKLESNVLEAVDLTIEDMLKNSKNVNPRVHIYQLLFNFTESLTFGKTYKFDDPEFIRLSELNSRFIQQFINLAAFDFLPFAKYLPLRLLPIVRHCLVIFDEFKMARTKQIEEHRRTFVKDEIRDYCDAMLTEQEIIKKEKSDPLQRFDDDHLFWIIMDFQTAGSETTSNVLLWFILYMVMHPDIQEECYQEIVEAVGDNKPKIKDRIKLPFTEACIMETMRLRPPAPMGLQHTCTEDTKLGNYSIVKGTVIFPNIYAMHIDPDYWENPLEFNPRRHFIDDRTGQVKKPASFAPFGFGRRICFGDQLAKNNMFLVVTRMLQKIQFEKLRDTIYTDRYDLKQIFSFVTLPFLVQISQRNSNK